MAQPGGRDVRGFFNSLLEQMPKFLSAFALGFGPRGHNDDWAFGALQDAGNDAPAKEMVQRAVAMRAQDDVVSLVFCSLFENVIYGQSD